ncbi:gluconokinase [Candidatus Leptofilum sp.]|uniref:gluconokinase n=1 Tax=Candidatus Leptofilum sp. TaxID=3241576 RepID=UPI003B590ABE
MIVILMGVSGCGKSTVGEALAKAWQRPFFDGDDYHPPENVAKMAAGLPLADADRAPWLASLRQLIDEHLAAGQDAVLATSALKASYRQTLGCHLPNVLLVHLHGSYDQILQRMAQRNHFMPPALLQSQFDTLEPPTDALVLDLARPVTTLVLDILAELNRRSSDAVV